MAEPTKQRVDATSTALLVTYYFPPSASVGAQRTLRYVRYLPEFGWRPVVLTVREQDFGDTPLIPPHARGEVTAAVYRARVLRPLEWALRARRVWRSAGRSRTITAPAASAPVESAETAPPGSPSFTRRWIDPWFMTPDANVGWWPLAVAKGLQAIRHERPDVLYTSGPPHSSHLVALTLKRLTGTPWIADFRDPWTRRPWLAQADRRGPRYRTQVRLEALVVQHADRIVLNTEPMGDDFRAFYPVLASKFRVIPNGYDPESYAEVPIGEPLPDVFTVTHTGALYRGRDPRPLIRAVALLRDRGIVRSGSFQLNLVGSVEARFQLRALVDELDLDGLVTMIPRVPHAESLGFLARSHLLLVIQPGTDLQVPGKLFEYLYIGKPMLALTGPGATADIIREYGLGTVADPGDVEGLASALACAHANFVSGKVPPSRREEAMRVFHGRRLAGTFASLLDEVTGRL